MDDWTNWLNPSALPNRVTGIWRRILYVLKRYGEDRCTQIAGSLTYMSLFALVPLLTVTYAMASAIPAFQNLEVQFQQFLFEQLVPETSQDLEQYFSEFSRQAKNLTGFGIAFLVITAILMLRSIEKAFNMIWRTGEHRSPIGSFLLYWAVLSLAPITIGVALGISAYLGVVDRFMADIGGQGLATVGLAIAPLILFSLAFTLLYVAVPNARVPLRHAFVGGVITALLFNVSRSLFTTLVINSSYTAIYGAFAAVPIFLLWIYLGWNIVLFGGVLVHSFVAYQDLSQASRPPLLKALDLLYVFWRQQQRGQTVRELRLLGDRYPGLKGLDSDTWRSLRTLLTRKRIITEDRHGHYLLCSDLDNLYLWQLKEWMNRELDLKGFDSDEEFPWKHEAYELLVTERANQREILSISLAQLFGDEPIPTEEENKA